MLSNKPYDRKYAWIIRLFNRCEQMKVLPRSGGIENQHERTMVYFDIIRHEFDEYQLFKLKKDNSMREAQSKLRGKYGK